MATSSILRNFTIADSETAEAFVNALDEAENTPPRRESVVKVTQLRDPAEIRKFIARRETAVSE